MSQLQGAISPDGRTIFVSVPGKTLVEIIDTATGKIAIDLPGRPNLKTYTIKQNSNYLIDMGFFPGKVPTEVPSYLWVYSNIHIETYLQ